jgi:HTH-type transcriptional regulator/antitoxin HigA
LTDAKRDSPEGDRLDPLVMLIEAWERNRYLFDIPNQITDSLARSQEVN